MTPEERRGWLRVAAVIATYAVIGCIVAAGLYGMIRIIWAGTMALAGF